MNPYLPVGVTSCSGTAVLAGPNPGTTQQLNVDNSECKTMRAVVGVTFCGGAAYVFSGLL